MRGASKFVFDPDNQGVEPAGYTQLITAGAVAAVPLHVEVNFTSSDGLGRQLNLDNEAAGDETNDSLVWRIVGTDADGRKQEESITDVEDAGADNFSTKHYKTVDFIEFSGTLTTAIEDYDLGINGVAVSPSLLLDRNQDIIPIVEMVETGTVVWNLQTTPQNVKDHDNQGDTNIRWTDDTNHAEISASQYKKLIEWPVCYARLLSTSYTDGGAVETYISQASRK